MKEENYSAPSSLVLFRASALMCIVHPENESEAKNFQGWAVGAK